ncbi:MAG: flagellar basal body P-ring formation protein FlgA [Rhodospirillales bacterium]|nr:flagellar basal body P-ring formation protein FlgA [Rhodospirillales bacterium]
MIRTLVALVVSIGIACAGPQPAAGDNRVGADGASAASSVLPAVALVGPNVTVEEPLVKLGDIFVGLDPKTADTAAAYAPQAGKRLVLDAQWLARAARRHNIAWHPAGPNEHVVVQRRTFVVTRGDVEARTQAMLAERLAGTEFSVELFSVNFRLHAASDGSDTFALEDFSYDPISRRFEATVAAPAASTMASRARVSGRVHKLIAVPALKRPISKGEIVRADDIEIVRLKADQAPTDIVTDRDGLIGKAAVRGLRAGHPVFARDVERPVLVTKDSLVMLVLQASHMRLTARGKALDQGSHGDVIRIVNEQSKQVVEGTVIGAGQAAVKPFGAVADLRPVTN